ncbi:MAG: hypothetical protein ACOC8B_00905 [Gemmatimonadota bacterium]
MTTEQRNEVSELQARYNTAFHDRHNTAYRVSAALHFAHGRQHDVLWLTPLAEHEEVDRAFDREATAFTLGLKARFEPSQEQYAPYTARAAWRVLRAIDWVHLHHEQTYDIMADRDIPWSEKKRWTDRAVAYFLEMNEEIAFSVAPLDVTMRRAAVMMKPYFTYFRNYYPRSNEFFYAAHWWHPVIYEAQMVGGNDAEQDTVIRQTDRTFYDEVLRDRPLRMLLLREAAPRYSRLSPESANIFDNLHMFHGIVYDILAYEGWTVEEKRAELYRVIDALSHQPGDERYVRKFRTPHPEVDPRVYDDWMRGTEGEMTRIMHETIDEMMPLMMPGGAARETHERIREQLRLKLTPGFQPGEVAGSLHDALIEVAPAMRTMPEAMEPGETPVRMVETMLRGWRRRYGDMPDVSPYPMEHEPTAPPLPPEARGGR